MSKVFITDYIDDPQIEKKILGDQLSNFPSKEVEVLIVWHQKIDNDFISQFPNLKAIIRYGVGYDNIDLDLLKDRNIEFANTPDYGVDEVSDTAIALTLNLVRNIKAYDYQARQNVGTEVWQELRIPQTRRLNNLKIGAIGVGRIGSRFLLKMKSLTNHLHFFDPFKPEGTDKVLSATRHRSLPSLIAECDIISIHCPLTPETTGMVNYQLFQGAGKRKILINTARGEIISSFDDLQKLLKEGYLIGAGLDVIPQEPPSPNSEFIQNWVNNKDHGRVIITPHSAFFSNESFQEMREKAAKNALRALNNQSLLNKVF